MSQSFAFPLYPNTYSTQMNISEAHFPNTDKGKFRSHTSIHAERLHRVSETILLPGRWCVQSLARVIEPLPGKNKDHSLWGLGIRVGSLALGILLTPVAFTSVIIGFPLRLIDHRYRPAMSYLDNSSSLDARPKSKEKLLLTQETPLHVRTHNVGFVSSSMSITGDLRPPTERAKELVKSILEDSKANPDVIFFQETFHEDATKILCEGIKNEYPYIFYLVAPQISGFSSGAMVASKYPIKEADFKRLGHMLGPEKASPRGIIRVCIESTNGPVLLYGVHTQALIGKKRADARFHQLEEIQQFMKSDAEKFPGAHQVLMGDFNTSHVTAWGENNLSPAGQAEEQVMNRLNEYFDDLYLRDHDPVHGRRTNGNPLFLPQDNERMGEPNFEEPSGSWYHGPFANPGWLLTTKMQRDRTKNRSPQPKRVEEIRVEKSSWGTTRWHSTQTANTARFDYILLPKDSTLDGRVEIRRVIVPPNAQSASSDHLPVDGRIWIN